ncbi:hypothetical protein [Prosthecobacter fluviatilis]|uniref:WD40-like Beta Propeller Repeat n=1 Tax=Prosthecobacter fluviatilis TaxID=445931 RepID=A0ABW0KPG0_9BACT
MPSFRIAILCLFSCRLVAAADPVAAWSKDVVIKPVCAVEGRHTTHSYYLTNPESPDGRHVLFFTSTTLKGQLGEVRMIERATGKETVLADNIHTEDAHRVACQQWLSGGKRVAFHEVIDKKWRVVVVDVETLKKTVVAEDHQVGFGRPEGNLLPMYGCHWNPGPYRDLEVWDAATGKTTTMAKISEVEAKHGEWLQKEFAGKPCSIFFPVLSPDLKKAFFKVAAGNGGDDYMSSRASHRQGTVVYDTEKGACVWQRNQWGHPAWTPDSQHIFEAGNISFDIADNPARFTRLKDVPNLSGTHPSVSPDGMLMVTDGMSRNAGGKGDEWGVMVADMRGGKWVLLHSFAQNGGAKSWRRNHPHPIFSADGKRIYYNVSDGAFTRLMVAERPQ